MKKAEFDVVAPSYDSTFTDSSVGRLQRAQVYSHLEPILKTLNGTKILELGCGTGEDAIWLAQKKISVIAIDPSAEMIKIAKLKTENAGLESYITYHQLSIETLDQLPEGFRFDLIFSDFGPLNCVDPDLFPTLAKSIYGRLEPSGHFIGVMMNRFCLWESLYFMLKGNLKKVFRRMQKPGIRVPIGNGGAVDTWYHDAPGFYNYFRPYFKMQGVKPIGFFVPPSYMSKMFEPNKLTWLNHLAALDRHNPISRMCSLASDHFFIHLTKK